MLDVYYQIPIYLLPALTPLKLTPLKDQIVSKETKKEEPLNLNLAEQSEAKALHFLLACVNENFKNQFLKTAFCLIKFQSIPSLMLFTLTEDQQFYGL